MSIDDHVPRCAGKSGGGSTRPRVIAEVLTTPCPGRALGVARVYDPCTLVRSLLLKLRSWGRGTRHFSQEINLTTATACAASTCSCTASAEASTSRWGITLTEPLTGTISLSTRSRTTVFDEVGRQRSDITLINDRASRQRVCYFKSRPTWPSPCMLHWLAGDGTAAIVPGVLYRGAAEEVAAT